jgi:hypothetical protein
MPNLFRLPQASNHPADIAKPEEARGRDDEIWDSALKGPPSKGERDEQSLHSARNFAARTKTIRRAGVLRGGWWLLTAAVATVTLGPAGGIAVFAVSELQSRSK